MKLHSFTYTHDGAEWALRIMASSPEDARARIGRLTWARYDGEVVASVPAGLGLFARLAVVVRNLFAS
jgi:hypothetical protein